MLWPILAFPQRITRGRSADESFAGAGNGCGILSCRAVHQGCASRKRLIKLSDDCYTFSKFRAT